MAAYAARAAGLGKSIGLTPRASRVLLALAVLFLVAALAFLVSERRHSNTTVLRGVAYTGLNEATITVDGWSYGILGTGNLTWIDGHGTQHDSGWPACLRGAGRHVPITFGTVPVNTPDGSSWRQVVWVDCRR
jgi:hypothetical protein